jgi:flagellar basal body-associated protein FliL
MADEKSKEEAAKTAAPATGGGVKAMLPLIVTIVLMPLLAFAMTQFVLVPKLQRAITASASTGEHGDEGEGETEIHGEAPAAGSGGHGAAAEQKPLPKGAKATWGLPKVIVNVKDTQATRYLMSSYTLVGKGDGFGSLLEANVDQIRDVTSGVLSTKGIQDLERPDARAVIKAELISAINTALGKPAVQEIWITEFAIQ